MPKSMKCFFSLALACWAGLTGCRSLPSRVQGGPDTKIAAINGQAAVLGGGRGSVFLTDDFTLGGGGYQLLKPLPVVQDKAQADCAMSLGGIIVGWEPHGTGLFSPAVNLLAGPGFFSVRQAAGTSIHEETAGFFYAEPEAGVNWNMSALLHLNLNVSYRACFGGSAGGLSAGAFTRPQLGLIVMFGPLGVLKPEPQVTDSMAR